MAQQKIRLSIKGKLSLPTLQVAVSAFNGLIEALANEADPDVEMEWILEKITGGSLLMESRARTETQRQRSVADHVADSYNNLGQAMARGRLEEFSEPVRELAVQLTSLINEQIPEIALGSNGQDWVVEKPIVLQPTIASDEAILFRHYVRTSIRGHIVTLSSSHGLYFTLKEAKTNRMIRCFASPKYKSRIGKCWTESSWVVVEGTLNRNSNTMRQITDIVRLPDAKPGDWRQAMGCIP